MPRILVSVVFEKVDEQIERITHLLDATAVIPLDWTPPIPGAQPIGWLYDHLIDAISGFCAVLQAIFPDALANFDGGTTCEGARAGISLQARRIREGAAFLQDSDLSRCVPTLFAPAGQTVLGLLLGNLEHLISHKYQLFQYIRCFGLDLTSRDLYHFQES